MTGGEDHWVLGADGGGTSCRVALARGAVRHEVRLGPANVATDFAGAVATLGEGLARVAEMAGLSRDEARCVPAHLALAGILSRAQAVETVRALELERAEASDDRLAAVVGALGEAAGSVAGVGTGSFLARRTGTTTRFAGGWGLVLGDEASGAWLGREALAATLRADDGLEQAGDLCTALAKRFNRPAGIVSFAATADPAAFAALAPDVVRAAQRQDETARALMRRGAGYLEAGLRALGWRPGEPVCLTGGLAPAYAGWLPADLAAALRPPAGTALDGALRLAAERQGGATDER